MIDFEELFVVVVCVAALLGWVVSLIYAKVSKKKLEKTCDLLAKECVTLRKQVGSLKTSIKLNEIKLSCDDKGLCDFIYEMYKLKEKGE